MEYSDEYRLVIIFRARGDKTELRCKPRCGISSFQAVKAKAQEGPYDSFIAVDDDFENEPSSEQPIFCGPRFVLRRGDGDGES